MLLPSHWSRKSPKSPNLIFSVVKRGGIRASGSTNALDFCLFQQGRLSQTSPSLKQAGHCRAARSCSQHPRPVQQASVAGGLDSHRYITSQLHSSQPWQMATSYLKNYGRVLIKKPNIFIPNIENGKKYVFKLSDFETCYFSLALSRSILFNFWYIFSSRLLHDHKFPFSSNPHHLLLVMVTILDGSLKHL